MSYEKKRKAHTTSYTVQSHPFLGKSVSSPFPPPYYFLEEKSRGQDEEANTHTLSPPDH